jgi:hypothetical protein
MSLAGFNVTAVWVGRMNNLPDYKPAASGLPIPRVGSSNKNDMNKEFQVEQDYGQGSKGWVYFSIDESSTEQEIKKRAAQEVKMDWDKKYKPAIPSILFNPQRCRPTIVIKEYKDGKVVRGGLKLKTRWR